MGDVLSMLYLSSAALKFYDQRGRQMDEFPLLNWALYDCAFQTQVAMDAIIENFSNRPIAFVLPPGVPAE